MFSLLAAAADSDFKTTFLYSLSSFTGTKPFDGARICHDPYRNEVYVITNGAVTIFNSNGMEIYNFEQDPAIGVFTDITFTSDRNMLVLARTEQQTRLVRCNFRGEPVSEVKLSGLPDEIKDFSPNRVIARSGKLYLSNPNTMHLVITDEQGAFIRDIDLVKTVEATEKDRPDLGFNGIAVGTDDTIYISFPNLALVAAIKPDGTTQGFGKRGSSPGRFGVNAGLAIDRNGNILVTDKLRTTVLVFDKNYKFVTEFGKRGLQPGGLIVPDDILVDNNNRVYISNLRKRGVAVFQITAQ